MLNMQRKEILTTAYAEMLDMISCYAIYNGAEPAPTHKTLSIEETLEVI